MSYDINLIPKSKKIISSKTKSIAIIIYAGSTILGLLFGLYLPLEQRSTLGSQVKQKENELSNYAGTGENYNLLLGQLDEIAQTDEILNSIKNGSLKATVVMKEIENNIPKSIRVKEMSLESGMLTIEGNADSFAEIAGFIVKLREIERVSEVSLISAAEDDTSLTGDLAGDNKAPVYNFTVYVKLNVTDGIAQFAVENTNEEAVQDEIDE